MESEQFKQQLQERTDTDTVVRGRPTNVDFWLEDEQEFLGLSDSVQPNVIFLNEIELTGGLDGDSKIMAASFLMDQSLVGIESTPENIEDYQQKEENRKEEIFHQLRGLEEYVPHIPSPDRLDRYSLEELEEKVEKAEKRKELVSKLEKEAIEVTDPSRQSIRELERMLGNSEEIREAQSREKEIAEEVASSARYHLGLSRKAVNLLIEEIAPDVNENPNIDKSDVSELARAYHNIRVRPQQMEDAKKLLKEGNSQNAVSEILGVSTSLVREAEKRRNIW